MRETCKWRSPEISSSNRILHGGPQVLWSWVPPGRGPRKVADQRLAPQTWALRWRQHEKLIALRGLSHPASWNSLELPMNLD